MKHQHLYTVIGTLILVFFLLACNSKQQSTKKETLFPVEVVKVIETTKENHLEYVGIISSQIVNYSFCISGRVDKIFVDKNDWVEEGTKLMQLETDLLELAIDVAKSQLFQAKIAFDEANNYYLNLKESYQSGGISHSDLSKAKLDKDVKEKDWLQAKINLQSKNDDLKHATIYALSNGIVSDIKPKVGEVIEAGSETVIVQGKQYFAETGIAQKDLDKVQIGSKAIIELEGTKLSGKVSYVSALPDIQTFRHTVKISFDNEQLNATAYVGQTVKVYLYGKASTGIWIPIKYVYNNGQDYVNVVENNRLRRKFIQLKSFNNEMVKVDGLKNGELLISKGAMNIKEGFKVKVQNEKNAKNISQNINQ